MKKGKDEGKVMNPLFPRLHVNDTEKGGPKAPPRNKMALYEQLSVPKVHSRSTFILPLPLNNRSSLVLSASSTQDLPFLLSLSCDSTQGEGTPTTRAKDSGHERNMVTPFCHTPTSARAGEKHHLHSSGGVNMTFGMADLEQKSGTFYHIPHVTGQSPLSANCSSSQPHHLSKPKIPRGEDDSEVPIFCQSSIVPDDYNALQNINGERATCVGLNSSVPHESARKKHHGSLNVSHTRESISATASSGPSFMEEIFESSKRVSTSLTEQNKSNVVVDISRSEHFHDSLHRGSMTQENVGLLDPSETLGCGYASTLPKPSVLDDHRSSRPEHEQNESEFLRRGSIDRNGHASNANLVGSMLGFDICPDDVVGIIGHKHFWKTRNAIVNQQRVFAVQVFELHRLIKVQRLIAGSPEELLDNNYLAKPSSPMKKLPSEPPTKKLTSENVQELPYQIVNPKVGSHKQNTNNEAAIKDAAGNPPLASPMDADETYTAPQTNKRPLENQLPVVSMATHTQPTSWCPHQSQGNQWLVPVMSPSEGLIYKPYTGRCPPTPGLMSPVYSNYKPINLTPVSGDFFNTGYGIPISHQQGIGLVPSNPLVGQTYFQPYGKSLVNPSTSGSAVEQMNRSIGDQSSKLNNHIPPRGDISATVESVHYQSLGNMPSQKSGGVSSCGKSQASKSSELQVSGVSTFSMRARSDALPLFPMASKAQTFNQPDQIHENEKQTRAIKVVPHKHKSATESAARIFRSIQEERNQRSTRGDKELKH